MSKDELKSRVKEFAEIADSIPEQYRAICFEKLLSNHLTPIEKNADQHKKGKKLEEIIPDDDFSNVYALEEEEVIVLQDPPGSSKKAKTKSAALIVLYAKSLIGEDVINTEEIRKVCENHAALNEANFATYLRGEKSLFIINGRGKEMTIKLTAPGKKKALELISEMAKTNGE